MNFDNNNNKKCKCRFCNSLRVEFFTGYKNSRQAMPIMRTAGFHCLHCGAVTYWTFPIDEYCELGVNRVRALCLARWKGETR